MAKKSNRFKLVKGKKQSGFLDLLGVSYGVLTVNESKDSAQFIITDPESAKQWFQNEVKEKNITAAEAREIKKAIEKTGLDSRQAILDKARNFPIPDNYSPLFYFQICNICPVPLPHGYILEMGTKRQPLGPIGTLEAGLKICAQHFELSDSKYKLDAVLILQEMIKANLCLNETDYFERYKALPKTKRDKIEKVIIKNTANGKGKPN